MPKKTFECAETVGAILITQVKNNQSTLKKQIEHGCRTQTPIEIVQNEIEKGHGRIEIRKYEVFNAYPMLIKWQKDWPYIRKIIRVTRYREEINKNTPTRTTM